MVREDLRKLIKQGIVIEKKAVEIYNETAESIENIGVRAILEGLARDSAKHQRMYEVIEKALEEDPIRLKDFYVDRWTDKKVARVELRKHIEMEKAMIRNITDQLETTDQRVIKAILENILEDEKRHHKLLLQIIESV